MPYCWTHPDTLHLWPHRSLPAKGFVWFIGITAALICVPLVAELGTPALWVMLPFVSAALAGIWIALRTNHRDRAITETLIMSQDQLCLTRLHPRAKRQTWEANPHWVRLTLHPTDGPVPNYLTLTGNGREVELGAFLTEPERIALKADLEIRLARIN